MSGDTVAVVILALIAVTDVGGIAHLVTDDAMIDRRPLLWAVWLAVAPRCSRRA